MSRLRLAYMGTPDFAVPPLQAINRAEHEIGAVYTQPPRPAGRGRKPRLSPVHVLAEDKGFEVRTPESLRGTETQDAFAALGLDTAVVAAFGLILPKAILTAPRLGCLNIHASLLPRWRGAAPIQRAILAGDSETGVTIMQMDEGLDTGAVLAQKSIEITPAMTAGMLHDALAALGADMIVETLAELDAGRIHAAPQPPEGATYAEKIDKAEARLDWSLPALELERKIRAFNPFPGAWAEIGGTRTKVLAAEIVKAEGRPGEVLDESLTVACGVGALRLRELQRAGKAALVAEAFLRGTPMPAGSRLA